MLHKFNSSIRQQFKISSHKNEYCNLKLLSRDN